VILLGVLLLVLGYVLYIPILILAVIGAVLFILGSVGRPVGGRSHYW
jgi:hypothetical protein